MATNRRWIVAACRKDASGAVAEPKPEAKVEIVEEQTTLEPMFPASSTSGCRPPPLHGPASSSSSSPPPPRVPPAACAGKLQGIQY
uniref:Uncharacterized protein n=1 Tax=Oryza meridionalis TaxID=40149 RepID=A0A0E0DB28_9ORYZ